MRSADPAELRSTAVAALLDTCRDEAARFDGVAELVTAAVEADAAVVTLVAERTQHLIGVFGDDLVGIDRVISPPGRWSSTVVESGHPVFIENVGVEAAAEVLAGRRFPACAVVPLHDSGAVPVGTICVLQGRPRRWSDADRAVLAALARGASRLLVPHPAARGPEPDHRRLPALYDLGVALSTASSTEQVAARALEAITTELDCPDAWAGILDRDSDRFLALGALGGGADVLEVLAVRTAPASWALMRAVEAGDLLWLSTPQAIRTRLPMPAEAFGGLATVVLVPLRVGERVIGAVGLNFNRPRPPAAGELDFLAAVGDIVGQALDRAGLRAEARAAGARATAAVERAERIGRLAAALVAAQTVEAVTAVLAEHVQAALDCQTFSLREVDPGAAVARAIRVGGAPIGYQDRFVEVGLDVPSALTEVVSTRRPVFLASAEENRRRYGIEAAQRYEASRGEAIARLPLLVEGDVLGVLSVGYWAPRDFDAAERLFLTTVADLAAQALGRAVRGERLRADARRHRLLAGAQAAINRRLDPAEQLRALSRVVVPELADFSSVHVLHHPVPAGVMPELPVLTDRVASEIIPGVEGPPIRSGYVWSGGDPITETIRQGRLLTQPQSTPRVPEWAGEAGIAATFEGGLHHLLQAPVLVDGLVVAVASFGMCNQRPAWDDADLAIIEEIAGYAAIALDHGLSYQRARETAVVSAVDVTAARRAAERAEQLARVAEALAAASSVEDVGAVLGTHVRQAVSCDQFSLRVIDPDTGAAQAVHLQGAPAGYSQRFIDGAMKGPSALAEAVATRQPVFVSSAQENSARYGPAAQLHHAAAGTEAMARLPLLVEDELIAILSIGYLEARELNAELRLFLTTVADLAAQALARAMRSERVRADARRHRLVSAAQATINRRMDPTEQLRALSRAVVPELADFSSVHVLAQPVPPGVMPALPVITDRVTSQIIPGVQAAPLQAGLAWYDGDPITETIRQGRLLTQPQPTPEVPEWATRTGTAETFRSGLNHVVLAPVVVGGLVVAVASFGMCHDRPPWDREDLATIEAIAGYAAIALDHGLTYQHSRETALVLQHALLSATPAVPGLELRGRYLPAGNDEVGGDWYDAFEVGPARLALAVGDVVGHDITAAAAMGQLRAALRVLALEATLDPGAVLERLGAANRSLHMTTFATALFARLTRLDEADWELHWAVAGHPPPVLIEPEGRARALTECRGVALVAEFSAPHPTAVLRLRPGSTLLLYTDGLIERRGVDLGESIEELAAVCGGMNGRPLDDLCDELTHRAHGSDDLALLAVRIGDGQ